MKKKGGSYCAVGRRDEEFSVAPRCGVTGRSNPGVVGVCSGRTGGANAGVGCGVGQGISCGSGDWEQLVGVEDAWLGKRVCINAKRGKHRNGASIRHDGVGGVTSAARLLRVVASLLGLRRSDGGDGNDMHDASSRAEDGAEETMVPEGEWFVIRPCTPGDLRSGLLRSEERVGKNGERGIVLTCGDDPRDGHGDVEDNSRSASSTTCACGVALRRSSQWVHRGEDEIGEDVSDRKYDCTCN